MKRLILGFGLLIAAAGCDPMFGEKCSDDPGANHFAVNPQTGACWQFASSCDVPSGWAACSGPSTVTCSGDPDCASGSYCVNSTCVIGGASCMTDGDCKLTEHCDGMHTPRKTPVPPPGLDTSGVCLPNDSCSSDSDCPTGLWCDKGSGTGTGDRTSAGVCSRGTPPTTAVCVSNGDCGSGQICPAQYGGCSPPTPPGGGGLVACPSVCEPTCNNDGDCATGYHCNNTTVCGHGNTDVPVACQGWCVLP
jgi:hypothetical protein